MQDCAKRCKTYRPIKNRKKGENFPKLAAKAGQRRALIPLAATWAERYVEGYDFEDTMAAAAKQLQTCCSMLSRQSWDSEKRSLLGSLANRV